MPSSAWRGSEPRGARKAVVAVLEQSLGPAQGGMGETLQSEGVSSPGFARELSYRHVGGGLDPVVWRPCGEMRGHGLSNTLLALGLECLHTRTQTSALQ